LAETKQALEENQAPVCIYAVDCPSGVDCDSGEMDENSLTATVTVCMEAVKVGLLKMPAFSKVGRLEVVSLELSPDLPSLVRVKNRVTSPAGVMETIPQRRLDAHKGTFGTAVIAAGSDRYPGAAMLAGKAAYRVGVGLVSMAVPDVLHGALAGNFLEATWILLPSEMGGISANAAAILHESMDRATALLVGPGWGTQDTTVRFLQRFLSQSSPTTPQKWELLPRERVAPASAPVPIPPLVIDADGLRALAKIENWVDLLPKETILTPHPGEMAGLTGLSTSEIQADRLGIARRYAQEWNCIVVLKGAFTVVAAPDGTTITNPVATPALARAGSGDVLAGMITGFLAQGMLPLNAAVAGVWLHGQCGLAAEQSLGGSASVLAGDLVDQIAWVLSRLSS
jgi:NAD(P)H-hydrate epimerase